MAQLPLGFPEGACQLEAGGKPAVLARVILGCSRELRRVVRYADLLQRGVMGVFMGLTRTLSRAT